MGVGMGILLGGTEGSDGGGYGVVLTLVKRVDCSS